MKSMFFVMLALFTVSAFARRAPSPEQMRKNFEICLEESDTFYLRWGRHLAGFSYNEAAKKCDEDYWHSHATPRLMGCRTSQGYLYAGYFCEERHN